MFWSPSRPVSKLPQRTKPVVSRGGVNVAPKVVKAIKLAAGLLGLLVSKSTAPRNMRSAFAVTLSANNAAPIIAKYFNGFIGFCGCDWRKHITGQAYPARLNDI